MPRTAITGEKIDVETLLKETASSSDGALLLFLGVVRGHHGGRQVAGLVYEAYREMAEETLERIAGEAEERFGTDRIRVLHRVGALEVGEVSTAIAVATPHREESYGASRYIIEEIKKRLPIWKHEHYLEGDAAWVEGEVPEVGGGVGSAVWPALSMRSDLDSVENPEGKRDGPVGDRGGEDA